MKLVQIPRTETLFANHLWMQAIHSKSSPLAALIEISYVQLPRPEIPPEDQGQAICCVFVQGEKQFPCQKQDCCPLSSGGWGATIPLQAQTSPVGGMSCPREAKDAKEAINLPLFDGPNTKE